MVPTMRSLLAVAVISTVLVAAAPTADKALKKAASLTSQSKTSSSIDSSKRLRRGKRQAILRDLEQPSEEDEIRQQLQELSDDQIAVLADIVQNELEKYVEERQPEYEIIEIPEMLQVRGRRSVPIIDMDEQMEEDGDDEGNVGEDVPELVVVPESVIEEALQEQSDDLELRARIAEIAQILNERATRRQFI